MKVSKSAYYDWCKRPGKLIGAQELQLRRRIKELFKASRSSLGSRKMMKALRAEGFEIGRYRVRRLMDQMGLKVTQRVAYKVTTKRKHSDSVAGNLLNQNFNPVGPNQIWAGDVTYCRTGEGWCSIATAGRSTPASGTGSSFSVLVCERVWATLAPAGTTQLLNDFLAA